MKPSLLPRRRLALEFCRLTKQKGLNPKRGQGGIFRFILGLAPPPNKNKNLEQTVARMKRRVTKEKKTVHFFGQFFWDTGFALYTRKQHVQTNVEICSPFTIVALLPATGNGIIHHTLPFTDMSRCHAPVAQPTEPGQFFHVCLLHKARRVKKARSGLVPSTRWRTIRAAPNRSATQYVWILNAAE